MLFTDSHASQISLRIGLAFVFFWFGIDKFIHPGYWLNAWFPVGLESWLNTVHLESIEFIIAVGVLETLIGVSLVSGLFVQVFSSLAVIFLIVFISIFGFNEITVRDLGLIGALIALVLWPVRRQL